MMRPSGLRMAATSRFAPVATGCQTCTRGPPAAQARMRPWIKRPATNFLLIWSRDGRSIVEEMQTGVPTGYDIWVLPVFGDRKPFPYLQTEFNERFAKLSPNSQRLAYQSDESRGYEVYVQAFPNPGGKWQVSTHRCGRPGWRRGG